MSSIKACKEPEEPKDIAVVDPVKPKTTPTSDDPSTTIEDPIEPKEEEAGLDTDINKDDIGAIIRVEGIQFLADDSRIQMNSIKTLNEIYDFLKKNSNVIVEIGGHTNGIPDHEYCDKLSRERAKSVADYLILKKGIPKEQVKYRGYGKRHPIATNETKEGRKKNQRVEIKILSVKG